MNWLLKNEITVVGTRVTDCIDLPDDLKNVKQRGEFESTMQWEKMDGNLSLCTYTTKSKSKGKKERPGIVNYETIDGDNCDDGKQKLPIIKFYDFTK